MLKRAKVIRLTVAVMAAVVTLSAPLAANAQVTARPVKIGILCAGGSPCGGPGINRPRPLVDALERIGCTRAT